MKCGYNCHSCGKHFTKKDNLWKHIGRRHVVESKVGKGKGTSFEKDQTMTELESDILRSTPAVVAEVNVLIYTLQPKYEKR